MQLKPSKMVLEQSAKRAVAEGKVQPQLIAAIKYRKQVYEQREQRSLAAKMDLATLVEGATALNLDIDDILSVEQQNALLDWKLDFEQYELERERAKEIARGEAKAERVAELAKRKGTTNAAKRRAAKAANKQAAA